MRKTPKGAVASLLTKGDARRCTLLAFLNRPISKATLLEAVVAKDVDTCVEVLASDNSGWNRSQCEGQQDELAEPEPQSEAEAKPASGAGCGYTGAPVPGAADFTSAALLAALVLYRRRRRCA